MKIEEIIQEYNMKRVLRDSLPTCKAEISILEEDENVQKYMKLKEHQQRYQYLQNQTDADILSTIISNDNDNLEDTYFCYGKSFIGHLRMKGGYYIEAYHSTSFRRLGGERVAKYRNLAKPADIVVIPSDKIDEFEQSHQVIQYTTAVPDEEYHEIRRRMYEEEIDKHVNGVKKLVKEPNHD